MPASNKALALALTASMQLQRSTAQAKNRSNRRSGASNVSSKARSDWLGPGKVPGYRGLAPAVSGADGVSVELLRTLKGGSDQGGCLSGCHDEPSRRSQWRASEI